MALTTALNSALTGLTAASRASAVVSDNLANSMTEGYGRRSLELTSATTGGGVRVTSVVRHADPAVTAQRRMATADQSEASTIADFHSRVASLVGPAADPNAIDALLAEFETSLVTAASRPESAQRLDAAVMRAKDVVTRISNASDGIQNMRAEADAGIAGDVDKVNQALQELERLNGRIMSMKPGGSEVASLLDQQRSLIDEINDIIPVRQIDRERGRVALYSQGGAILLDGTAATLSFTQTHQIVPEMTAAGGGLSGLEINGVPVDPLRENGPVSGGSLAAKFLVRDDLSISAQAELDALARDLVERFETPGMDSTQPAGAPGLFTDAGNALDPSLETGLSGRLKINAAVDPENGGASWRLRAGLGATTAGDPGDARQIQAFSDVLSVKKPMSSGGFGTANMSAADVFSALLSGASARVVEAERSLSFSTTTAAEMSRMELADGVDTDAELQRLMSIEQAYAANARMMQVVDDLMETLLRI